MVREYLVSSASECSYHSNSSLNVTLSKTFFTHFIFPTGLLFGNETPRFHVIEEGVQFIKGLGFPVRAIRGLLGARFRFW